MKRITAILLALIMAFSVFAVIGYADGAAVTAYVAQYDETDGDIDRVVNWYEINGKFYFFIPASINYDAAKFFITGGNVTVDSATYAEAKTLTEVFGDKTEVKVGSDGRTFDVVIVNESKTASVFINTESGNLDYIHAQKGNEEEGLIEIVDAEGNTVYEGGLEIKGRGNSTWQMEKKPYNIKLDDKENLFDMGKTKKWSLIANHGDDSMIRNVLAYEAAERAGMPYNPQFTPVDVYINGNYMGAYLLTTRIGIDKSNVDIEDLEGETEDANDEDLETYPRGGYYGKYAGLLEGTKKWFEIPNDPADITGGISLKWSLQTDMQMKPAAL